MNLLVNKLKKTFIITFILLVMISSNSIISNVSAAELEKESNNTTGTANSIKLQTEYTGILKDYNDIDYYKVEVSNDGNISLIFKHPLLDNEWRGWNVSLLNEYGVKYGDFTVSSAQGLSKVNIGIYKGTYYIKVNGSISEDPSKYSIQVDFTQSNNFEKESNDKISTANPINLNTEYTSRLDNMNDIDYYKFNIPNDGKIKLIFKHELDDSLWNYWDINITNEYGDTFKKLNIDNTKGLTDCYIDLLKGTYYVKVTHGFGTSSMDYMISINGNFNIGNFKSEKKQLNIPTNKIWEFAFEKEIDSKTIKEQNIYITDNDGTIIPMLYSIENKIISIIPIKEYDKNKTYTLWTKDILFKDGTKLVKSTKLDFEIQK